MNIVRCVALASFLVWPVSHSLAQTPDNSSDQAPADEQPKSPADLAFEPIARDFNILFESLRNKGGIAPEDHSILNAIRQRVAEFHKQFPNDLRGPAVELTLATWLKENDLAEKLYADIMKTAPDKIEPRLAWANRLKAQNRYAQAIDVLRGAPIDPAKNPEAFVTLSECLFAQERFQEAVEALDSIPTEVLDKQLQIKFPVDQAKKSRKEYVDLWAAEQSLRQQEDQAGDLPRALLVTQRGPITLELFENQAPNTVANFVSLVEQGFYNGTKFHRVMPNFMAQGGDPNTKEGATGVPGQGNPGYFIADEVGREDHRKHFTGSLAMAKTEAPNTAGCQFYITHAPTPPLNGKYTVFGRVIDGLDVARAIKQDDVIESIAILRKRDHEYKPQTLPTSATFTPPTRPNAPTTQPTTIPATIQPPPTTQPTTAPAPE
ncbi:MAG: peptidylprolyl isomerase [Phycisphaerales bacterium]|nr:peptidylprolyl isomerase [Phycisphaerales bacterium]